MLGHCSNHQQEQRLLSPTGLFSLRSLMPRWQFDGRQQDAAEFLSFLLQGNTGTLQPVDWHGRTDGILETADQGLTPLVLPLTQVWCHTAAGLHRLVQSHLPALKNNRWLDLRQRLSLPTWGGCTKQGVARL